MQELVPGYMREVVVKSTLQNLCFSIGMPHAQFGVLHDSVPPSLNMIPLQLKTLLFFWGVNTWQKNLVLAPAIHSLFLGSKRLAKGRCACATVYSLFLRVNFRQKDFVLASLVPLS